MTNRREFLKASSLVGLGATVPTFLARTAIAAPDAAKPGARDTILVVVQLTGGNDGLNTVIPTGAGNEPYLKARPTLGLKDRTHRLDDTCALNPGMQPFKELFDDGQLAVINGCGYPNPNRSHFRSMEIWHTANPTDKYEPAGWLGHYVDHMLRGTSGLLSAVNIGPELPQALVAEKSAVPSIQSIDDFRIRTDPSAPQDAQVKEKIIRDLNKAKSVSPALEYLSRQATNAIIEADQIRKVTASYKPDAEYPYGLGQQLKLIAQLITGNFGTKLFYCQTGGFDTHASQVGTHERILNGVAGSIRAFHKDMAAKGFAKKVTVMCFSEFGRRVNQNSSAGTDHGTAGPMFVSGAAVKGGVYGAYPSLTDLDNGDLKYTTDFRRIYATLLDNWLNADSTTILKKKFETVAFL